MSKSIFLPVLRSHAGLSLVVVETFDRPIRYFTDPKDDMLMAYWRSSVNMISTEEAIKTIGNFVIGEESSWDLKYAIVKTEDDYYTRNAHGLTTLKLDNMTTVFNTPMPAELQVAIIRLIQKELSVEEPAVTQ